MLLQPAGARPKQKGSWQPGQALAARWRRSSTCGSRVRGLPELPARSLSPPPPLLPLRARPGRRPARAPPPLHAQRWGNENRLSSGGQQPEDSKMLEESFLRSVDSPGAGAGGPPPAPPPPWQRLFAEQMGRLSYSYL